MLLSMSFQFMFMLLLLLYLNCFLYTGWLGATFFLNNWVCFNLGLMSIFLLLMVLLTDLTVELVVLSKLSVFLSLLFFGTHPLLLFFFIYELVMLPIIVMITNYGMQPAKISSVYYTLIYTGTFSLYFFYVIFSLDNMFNVFILTPFQMFMSLSLFLSKSPLFFFHIWLPKAHVEAPTSASMLLAGLMLKVGIFGFLKLIMMLKLSTFLINIFSLCGLVLAPFLAGFSSDTKMLTAYSSVSHINLLLYSVNILSVSLNSGGYLVSMSHGYISACVFFLVGEMYHSLGTRIFYFNTSVSLFSWFLMMLMSLIILGNLGMPPYLSFWGEIILIMNNFLVNFFLVLLFIMYFMFSFYYSIFMMMHFMKPSVVMVKLNLHMVFVLLLVVCLILNFFCFLL